MASKSPEREREHQTCEQRGSDKMGTALISGARFTHKSVVYYEVDGLALVEGDIALGMVESIKASTLAAREAVRANPSVALGVGITGSQFRWPNCTLPYEIDPALPNPQRVTDAIAHWEANTPLRFPLRTPANAGQFPNYLRFTDQGGCWSYVGMQGGQQVISLGAGCSTGNAIHEIGHAVGLWHEQSREDRDLFVTIQWQNIQAGMAAQFNQHITDGDDHGPYDYGSIMHYPRTAFSANGQDTIVPTDPNAQIGQRNGLSAGDIGAVRAMYPECGLSKLPAADTWNVQRFKKLLDDANVFKKLRDDRGKPFRDPKPWRDPGPKGAFDPLVPVRPEVVTPGRLLPFSLLTGHHAVEAAQFSGGEGAAGLDQELLELQAAIAEAQASEARARAEASRLTQYAAALAQLIGSPDAQGTT